MNTVHVSFAILFFLKIPLGIVLLQQYWGSIYNYFLDPPMILLDNHDRAVA